MKTDSQIQQDVLDELRWDVSIDEGSIGVAVRDGVVTLSGHVPMYAQKRAAERAAKRVAGVRAIAEEIQVRLLSSLVRDDADIARAAINALSWFSSIPKDSLKVTVERGWLTLEGEVDWQYQRDAAYDAVRNLNGVIGVTNIIAVKRRASPVEVHKRIEDAFKRHAQLESNSIVVEAADGVIKLKGSVSTWAERDEAEHVAWNAPGVREVRSDLKVVPRLMYA